MPWSLVVVGAGSAFHLVLDASSLGLRPCKINLFVQLAGDLHPSRWAVVEQSTSTLRRDGASSV